MQFLQGKLLVKISMKALEKVADSVLALTVPDERTISFTAGQLFMTVGRYSLQRLSGLEIKAGKGRFILPSKSQLLLAGVNKTSFVDVQVGFLPFRQISIQFFLANTETSHIKVAHWVPSRFLITSSNHIACFAFDMFNCGTWDDKKESKQAWFTSHRLN